MKIQIGVHQFNFPTSIKDLKSKIVYTFSLFYCPISQKWVCSYDRGLFKKGVQLSFLRDYLFLIKEKRVEICSVFRLVQSKIKKLEKEKRIQLLY